jgi:hypothetical protein
LGSAGGSFAWALGAKQRRRRPQRQQGDADDDADGGEEGGAAGEYDFSDGSTSSSSLGNDVADLPDFVLPEDDDDASASASSSSSPSPASSSTYAASDAPQGQARTKKAAAASAGTPVEVKSIRELLGDRSLEKKMVFDGASGKAAAAAAASAEEEELPDLAELAASRTKSFKRQEQAARKAALQASAAESSNGDKEDDTASLLKGVISKLPIIEVTNDKGEVTPNKLLEAGTWLGIFLLVAWEFYINSPLFDRAAPMAPVVY